MVLSGFSRQLPLVQPPLCPACFLKLLVGTALCEARRVEMSQVRRWPSGARGLMRAGEKGPCPWRPRVAPGVPVRGVGGGVVCG